MCKNKKTPFPDFSGKGVLGTIENKSRAGVIGLDWIGLDWIGLDWIGLDCKRYTIYLPFNFYFNHGFKIQ